MKLIAAVLVLAIFSLVIFSSGCTMPSFLDRCKSQMEDCNYACGEGILSSLCKEKCTYEYNRCKDNQTG